MGKLVNTNQHRGDHEADRHRSGKRAAGRRMTRGPIGTTWRSCPRQDPPRGRARWRSLGKAKKGIDLKGERKPLPTSLTTWMERDAKARSCAPPRSRATSNIRLHIVPALGHTRSLNLTAQDVQRFLKWPPEGGALAAHRAVHPGHPARRPRQAALGNVERNVAALASPPRQKPKETQLSPPTRPSGSWTTRDDRLGALSPPPSTRACARASYSGCAGPTWTSMRARSGTAGGKKVD